jgi:hypothetical protein
VNAVIRRIHVVAALCAAAIVSSLLAGADRAVGQPSTTTVDPSPSAPTAFDAVCAEAATTTTSTSTTAPTTASATAIGPSLCDVLAQLPADRITAGWDSVWDGTVSGSVQPVGCTPVPGNGSIVLVAFADGEVVGLGRTDSGAYSCENGAEIPPSSHAYGIAGERTDRFTLTFEDGVTLTSGPIVDGHAVLRQDTGFGVVTIELQCRDCATDETEPTAGSQPTG